MNSNSKTNRVFFFLKTFFIQVFLLGVLAGLVTSVFAATPSTAQEWLEQGNQWVQSGNFEEAVSSYSEAARGFETEQNRPLQSQALVQLAYSLIQLGHYDRSRFILEFTVELNRKAGDVPNTALATGQLGNVWLALGKEEKGLTLLEQSLKLARESNQPLLIATILNDWGTGLVGKQAYEEALAAFTESYVLASTEQASSLAIRAMINSGFIALRQPDITDAGQRLEKAHDLLALEPQRHDTAYALLSIGRGFAELLKKASGLQQEKLAFQAATTLHDAATLGATIKDWRAESYGWGYLGHLYEQEERWNESLELTRRAVLASQKGHAPESLYRWEWQMARILQALGKTEQALNAYQRAIGTVQPIRRELALGFEEPTSFRSAIGSLFFETADLLSAQVDRSNDPAIKQAGLRQMRNTIESYKAAELQDYFKDDCVEATQTRIQSIDLVSTATAIVYPILFSDRLDLLVSIGETIHRVSIAVTETELSQSVRTFRHLLEKRTTRQYLPHAQALYNLLIRPIEPLLKEHQITTLVFVPDGPLRTIPMSALHTGEHFLIEQYAVATTPGLTLTDAEPLQRGNVRLLSVGLTEAAHGFPALPNVKDEVEALKVLYGGEVLLNDQFVIPRMEQEMKQEEFTIVHIASHGKFEPAVEDSFLLAFDGKLTMNQLDELVGLFQFRETPLDLLTLSACETAAGDDRAALGLAGVAIKAGARSALASLWFINDKVSSDIIEDFYKELKNPSISKAQALRQAQRKILEHPVYQHPGYWSPFLLINNWL